MTKKKSIGWGSIAPMPLKRLVIIAVHYRPAEAHRKAYDRAHRQAQQQVHAQPSRMKMPMPSP